MFSFEDFFSYCDQEMSKLDKSGKLRRLKMDVLGSRLCSESIVRRYRSSVLFIDRKRSLALARRLNLRGMIMLAE